MDIKKIIKKQGYTVAQVAEQLSISQPALSKQLQRDGISISRCKDIARIINVPLSVLVADEEEDTPLGNTQSSAQDTVTLLCPHCKMPIALHAQKKVMESSASADT